MADIKIGSEGGKGPKGERGPRGHEGSTGPTGPIGTAGLTGSTGPTGSTGSPPIFAAAVVGSDGTFRANTGFTSVDHPSTGVYEFGIPPLVDTLKLAVEVSQDSIIAGMITYHTFTLGPPFLVAYTFDATGTLEDREFSIVVYNLT